MVRATTWMRDVDGSTLCSPTLRTSTCGVPSGAALKSNTTLLEPTAFVGIPSEICLHDGFGASAFFERQTPPPAAPT